MFVFGELKMAAEWKNDRFNGELFRDISTIFGEAMSDMSTKLSHFFCFYLVMLRRAYDLSTNQRAERRLGAGLSPADDHWRVFLFLVKFTLACPTWRQVCDHTAKLGSWCGRLPKYWLDLSAEIKTHTPVSAGARTPMPFFKMAALHFRKVAGYICS